jgi:hypothetical protein
MSLRSKRRGAADFRLTSPRTFAPGPLLPQPPYDRRVAIEGSAAVYSDSGPRAILTQSCQGTEDEGSVRHGLLDELLGSKDRFWNHSMNAFGAVHGLCDMIVDGHARNHVGLLACEMRKSLRNQIDRFAHGNLHRIV